MKPQQILDLEKYWGIEIEDNRFEVEESGLITNLNLSFNQISDISPLKDLTQLTSLFLLYNPISDISPLKDLTQLTSLFLSANQISDISPLKDLTQLTSLSLDNNEISDVSIIKDLINLVEIDIRRNRIEKIVLEKELPKLKIIQLWQNKINNIDFVKQLPNLEYLDISFNNITHLEPIQYLLKLQSGDFRSNNIINIRPLIHFIKAGVPIVYSEERDYYEINLYDNPLTHPPVEIVKQGNKAILDWFDEYEKSQAQGIQFQPLNEVRVIILGWGKVGKTTLRKRLLGEAVSETETQTDGIDIDIWRPEGLPDVALRVWDFGGQEIQHSVHNLFLQDNCVYLLVIDKRKDQNKNEDLVYWLEHIRSFGGQSPILIVENSIDTDRSINAQSTPEDIADLVYLSSEIRQSFPDANIDYVGVSALKGYNIDTLKTKLFTLAAQQNNEGLYAPDWLAAKNEVEQSITQGTELGGLARQNYITKETFDLECIRHQIAEATDHNTLLNVMQQLGVVSYYKKSDDKANWLILNPEWLTTAIYSVLLHPNLKRLNGHFQRSDVLAILSSHIETEGFFSKKNYQYSETEMGYVLDLMLDFELCFSPNNQDFYFPLRFKDNFQSQFEQENPIAISFSFDYEILPRAIWHKLVIRLFKRKLVSHWWGSGIELEYRNTKSLISISAVSNTKKIQIWISGLQQIELLTLVRYELDFVHEEFKSIPVTPQIYVNKDEKIEYRDLIGLFSENKNEYKKPFSNTKYNVSETLRLHEPIEMTARNIVLEWQKSTHDTNFELLVNELKRRLTQTVILNLNINQNQNIIENRFELPQEVNVLEGQLNFLIEELKDKANQQAQLIEILKKIDELRIVPTKEQAQKKGFGERFKKITEYFKTGSDLAKSIEELKEYVDIDKIKEAIELILQNIQS